MQATLNRVIRAAGAGTMLLPRRLGATLAAIAMATGMLAAAPVLAQAPLDLTIDPTEGVPGTVVTGQVDPADVEASCVTDQAEFQAQFTALLDEVFDLNGDTTQTELFQRFFPGESDFVFETCEQLAFSITGLTSFGIAENVNGAADTAFPQTFVLTFADIATQEPLGELSTFDPVTGTGTVLAPDLAPGPYPVVATCVGPSFDLDTLETGIRETGEFLRSIGFTDEICDPNDPLFSEKVEELFGEGTDLFAFLELIGTDVVQNIVEFQAIGLQFFTILAEPADRISDVLADIQALVNAGRLRANQARGLAQHLTNALRSLGEGDLAAACDQLAAFGKVAAARVQAGALTQADADALTTEVDSIRVQLGCIPPPNGSPSGAFLDAEGCS